MVGATIDAKRAHHRAQSGELIQLVRGVYVDHGFDSEADIPSHAVRIPRYLYPNAYLAGGRMALKLNGKDARLTRQDFLALARTIGLTGGVAEAGLDALSTRIAECLTPLKLLAFSVEFDGAKAAAGKVVSIAAARCPAIRTALPMDT